MQVKRRHVVFVQGYDPRGLAQHYRTFRTELKKFGALYRLTSTITRPVNTRDDTIASWTIDTEGPDWSTVTQYDFLRWEDLIAKDFKLPIARRVFDYLVTYGHFIANGALLKFWKAHWRFATMISTPLALFVLQSLVAAGFALGAAKILSLIGMPWIVDTLAGIVIFIFVLQFGLRTTEQRTLSLYLMSDIAFTYRYAHGKRPDWDARRDTFVAYLIETIRASNADEFIIVGHSSGSFLAMEILADAIARDSGLGTSARRIHFLTVGANLPLVGFMPAAQGFRDKLKQLAVEPSVDWLDAQSRKDVLNFYPFDQVAGHGIDVGAHRRNPTLIDVRFRDVILPENYTAFRREFFRMHFQFVMANEIPHHYDYFMMICGPLGLKERFEHERAALAIATGDAETRAAGWDEIEARHGPEIVRPWAASPPGNRH